jgi:metal-responsive CopG/Arc/MetJ family transcriptional regulator
MTMQRTQIYLERELADALDRVARRRGTTRAEVIRLAARRYLAQEGLEREDPIVGIIGLGASRAGRTSEEHDRILADEAAGSPT